MNMATMGRPLKFQSVEEMQEQIDTYFKECDRLNEPYLITGLALALDTSRETLLDYEDKADFSDTIKKAKLKCQMSTEKILMNGKNATGAIFSLKNNYGWVDRTEQKQELSGELKTGPDINAALVKGFTDYLKSQS